MTDYILLTFHIDSELEPQRAKVRKGLSVDDLITNIVTEFELGDANDYEIYHEGAQNPLIRGESLSMQHIQENDTLVFTRPVLRNRQRIQSKQKASLELAETNQSYHIQWQPAVIGRPDADPVHSGLLAVNLGWHPNSRRISRRHAQITEDKGTYFIESLVANNATYLNQQRLMPGERYPLKDGDRIFLRNSKVRLNFVLQENADSS